jgi:hypothetical protein
MTTFKIPVAMLAGILLGAVGAGVAGRAAPAQNATRREAQFENDQVRVWKTFIAPRQPLSFHRHENNRVLIALTDGHVRVMDTSAKELTTYKWERGKAYWLEADPPGKTHADANDTNQPIEVIVVELKQK